MKEEEQEEEGRRTTNFIRAASLCLLGVQDRITEKGKDKEFLSQAIWPDERDIQGLTQHVHWSKAPSK